jgi:putative transposase
VHCGETIVLAGMKASIGTVDDAYDNAVVENTIGLHNTEAVRKDSPLRVGPLRSVHDVEHLTADWVHWYNTSRLMHRLGLKPPVEYEADYHAHHTGQLTGAK